MIKKNDSIWIGIAIGIIVPLLFFGLILLLLKYVKLEEHTQSFLYILGIGINALIMRYAMKKGYTKIGTGIILVSFIYAVLFFYYKLRLAS